MLLALGDSLIERVLQGRVMRPEGELRNHVGEVEGWGGAVSDVLRDGNGLRRTHTRVIQMRRVLAISVAARGDVEVTLHLVPFKASVDATGVWGDAAAHTRALVELATRVVAHFAEDVADVGVGLLLDETVGFFVGEGLVFVGTVAGLVVALLHPEEPICVVAFEELAG